MSGLSKSRTRQFAPNQKPSGSFGYPLGAIELFDWQSDLGGFVHLSQYHADSVLV